MCSGLPLFRVFIPFAVGYFLSYLYRVLNAVIAPDLVKDLALDPSDLGLLTSAYFLSFAVFQLPLGLLLDHFGPRKTESTLLLFASVGAFIFASSTSITGLIVGRLLIGLGVSACLMAAFKAYSIWVEKDRLPLINGFQMAAGGLGALTGTMPIEAALIITDWRGVFQVLGTITLLVALLIFFLVPKRKYYSKNKKRESPHKLLTGVIEVFTSPVFWWIAPLTVSSQAAFLSIQSLWTGPWLLDVEGLTRGEVATHLLFIAASMIGGFIIMAIIADKLRQFKIKLTSVAITGMSIFIIVQIIITFRLIDAVLPLWMLFGFFATTGILPYAALSQKFSLDLAGRVNTGLNLLVFLGAFSLQWGSGVVIEFWPKSDVGKYDSDGYQAAFAMIIMLQLFGLLWLFLFKKGRKAHSCSKK